MLAMVQKFAALVRLVLGPKVGVYRQEEFQLMNITGDELCVQLRETVHPNVPRAGYRFIPGRSEYIFLASVGEDLNAVHREALGLNLDLGYFALPLDLENYDPAKLKFRIPEGTEVYFAIEPHPKAIDAITDIADLENVGASLRLSADESSGALLAHCIGLNLPIRIITSEDPGSVLIASARMDSEDLSPREWAEAIRKGSDPSLSEEAAESLTEWVTSITQVED